MELLSFEFSLPLLALSVINTIALVLWLLALLRITFSEKILLQNKIIYLSAGLSLMVISFMFLKTMGIYALLLFQPFTSIVYFFIIRSALRRASNEE